MVSQKKTVCMLIYNYYPNWTGGAEKQCRLQAIELVRTGYKCIILTARVNFDLLSRETDCGCEIVRVPIIQPLVDYLLAFKNKKSTHSEKQTENAKEIQVDQKANQQDDFLVILVKWMNTLTFMMGAFFYLCMNRSKIDLIHTHVASWNAGFSGWVGNMLKIPTLCKAAYHPPFEELGRGVPFSATLSAWRKKGYYIALVPEMANELYAQGVPKENVFVIPNGVDVPANSSQVERNTSVLYVGNFTQGTDHKGFDVLLKSWSIVCQELPKSRLVIVGGGERERWEQMAKDLGCFENIIFRGHVMEIDTEYKRAGLFVLPSRGEGMSNALLEAQSYGVPAIVSDIPGNREIIIDKETGLVVPIGDHKQFATAIIEMVQHATARKKMGIAARENCIKKFSIAAVVKQIESVYTDHLM